jgi:hypothetical protein
MIVSDSQDKGITHQVNLRCRLSSMKCAEGEDLSAHLTTMRTIKEDLAKMKSPISEDEFVMMIMSSVPKSYENIIKAYKAAPKQPWLRYPS